MLFHFKDILQHLVNSWFRFFDVTNRLISSNLPWKSEGNFAKVMLPKPTANPCLKLSAFSFLFLSLKINLPEVESKSAMSFKTWFFFFSSRLFSLSSKSGKFIKGYWQLLKYDLTFNAHCLSHILPHFPLGPKPTTSPLKSF